MPPTIGDRPSVRITLRERTRVGPNEAPLLKGTVLEPSEASACARRAAPLVDLYDSTRGLTLVARDRIGVVSLPVRRAEQKAILRVCVTPANPAVSLEDFVRLLLLLEGSVTFGDLPVSAGESSDFIEVVCRALLDVAMRLQRRGPCRAYVEEGIDGTAVRGRLDQRHYAESLAQGRETVRSIRNHHTSENPYNWVVAAGLRWAAMLAGGDRLRRRCRLVSSLFSDLQWPFPAFPRSLPYVGQFAPYRFAHALARVLARQEGGDPTSVGESAFLPFVIQPSVLYQRFLTKVVTDALRPDYLVESRRYYAFEDGDGRVLVDRGFLIPDIQVVTPERRLLLLVDAKYEEGFPGLSAGDYYQAYVYGHLLAGKAIGRPLPVVLAAPAEELVLAGLRRGNVAFDATNDRPTTWVLGLPLRDIARAVGRGGLAPHWRERVKDVLMRVVSGA